MIDFTLQQLHEIQADAIRVQAEAVMHAGQPEGVLTQVILQHLEQAMHTLEDHLAGPRSDELPETGKG